MTAHSSGLTLVEVLVATILLGIVLVALSNYLLSIPRVNVQTTAQQTATLNAKRYFEQVRTTLKTNFDTPDSALPAAPTGCTAKATQATLTYVKTGVTITAVRRVQLDCAAGGKTYPFAQDYGRPL